MPLFNRACRTVSLPKQESIVPAILPESLINSLKGVNGFTEATFVQVHEAAEQVTSIRMNPAKPFDPLCAPFQVDHAVPWCPGGAYLDGRPSFTFDPLLHGGAYYVQEASSMFLWQVLEQACGRRSGLKVLDLCAAPGGKSTLLATYFSDSLIVANEVIKARSAILVENIAKWGCSNVVVTSNDPADFSRLPGCFDVMLVDAPCSGSGMFRKDPDAIAEWSPQHVALCSSRQQRILADAWETLKPGGLLVYATCSYSLEEDEQICDWLYTSFGVSGCRVTTDPAWGVVETITENGLYAYRFYPDHLEGEGFFIAAMRKPDGESRSVKPLQVPQLPLVKAAIVNSWLRDDVKPALIQQSDSVIGISFEWLPFVGMLQKHLYLRKAGVTIGAIKGKDLVPHHELALSTLISIHVQQVALSREDAIRFLQKKDMAPVTSVQGWALITYCGIGLGWVKVLHNRVNNYYPVGWRILKD